MPVNAGVCPHSINLLQSVDLMGSDPLLTVVEAKNGDFFPSTAVMKGSDPIKSTASYWAEWGLRRYPAEDSKNRRRRAG